MAAVVNQNPNGKFYLNEVVDSEGNYIRIEEAPSDNPKSRAVNNGKPALPEGASTVTVPQAAQVVNTDSAITQADVEKSNKVDNANGSAYNSVQTGGVD